MSDTHQQLRDMPVRPWPCKSCRFLERIREAAEGEMWRTKVIYRTNMRTSYMARRWAQLQRFPLWIYRHGGSVEPRLDHLGWDGLILPREHPF